MIKRFYYDIPSPIGFVFNKLLMSIYGKKCSSLDNYVEVAFGLPLKSVHLSIRPAQVKEEITQLMKFLQNYKLKNICEIGTARGGTLFLLSKVSDLNATIISIDIGGYPKWKTAFYRSFVTEQQKNIFNTRRLT